MLSFIPIIGPIIQGLSGIIGALTNTEVVKFQTQATVETAAIQASAQIIQATEHDWGVRLARDLIMFPVSCWMGLIVWDSIFYQYPWLVFTVSKLPDSIAYMPYAVLAFLFGSAAMNVWRTK